MDKITTHVVDVRVQAVDLPVLIPQNLYHRNGIGIFLNDQLGKQMRYREGEPAQLQIY